MALRTTGTWRSADSRTRYALAPCYPSTAHMDRRSKCIAGGGARYKLLEDLYLFGVFKLGPGCTRVDGGTAGRRLLRVTKP